MRLPSGTRASPPALPPATALNVPACPIHGCSGCHVYVPWTPRTTGAGADGLERTKNIHARPKTMASATRVTTKLGGRRFIRPERIARLVRSDGSVIRLWGVAAPEEERRQQEGPGS